VDACREGRRRPHAPALSAHAAEGHEKRPQTTAVVWGRFLACAERGSDVVGQFETALRSPGSAVPSLLSDVNLGAGFFDGALWAHFDSRRVAERYRRHERFRRKVRRSAAGFL
jgi:hypothetical protein